LMSSWNRHQTYLEIAFLIKDKTQLGGIRNSIYGPSF
jgi:hypothetical protein